MEQNTENIRWFEKNGFGETAFHFPKPMVYRNPKREIPFFAIEDAQFLEILKTTTSRLLGRNGIHADVMGRLKSLSSIHCKAKRTGKSFKTILDQIGLRIIVQTVPECYRVLTILHSHFHAIPNRFKDYIRRPKDNGYQSLHTCVYPVRSIQGKPIEFQIRTKSMHQKAEFGGASHYQYKCKTKIQQSCESVESVARVSYHPFEGEKSIQIF